MADNFLPSKRSDIMARVRKHGTKPEIIVRKTLFAAGFRYRNNYTKLPGKPDIVLPRFKVAILVHGCFWHGHDCKAGKLPTSNIDFWTDKIAKNATRDKHQVAQLRKLGWKVFVVWQCQLRTLETRVKTMNDLIQNIRSVS